MQFHSSNAKHKLSIVALLLVLFAVPFALQWRAVTAFDSQTLMAGGAVIGNSAFAKQQTDSTNANNIGSVTSTAGSNFVGSMAH
jgi:hypothetical protein